MQHTVLCRTEPLTWEEHKKHISMVMQRLQRAGHSQRYVIGHIISARTKEPGASWQLPIDAQRLLAHRTPWGRQQWQPASSTAPAGLHHQRPPHPVATRFSGSPHRRLHPRRHRSSLPSSSDSPTPSARQQPDVSVNNTRPEPRSQERRLHPQRRLRPKPPAASHAWQPPSSTRTTSTPLVAAIVIRFSDAISATAT